MDEDSSIDGDLEEFLRKNGISGLDIPNVDHQNLSFGSAGGEEDDLDAEDDRTSFANLSRGLSESIKHLIPSVHKVTEMLEEQGFDALKLQASDVDASKKLSVFVVDEWANAVLLCIEEMQTRLDAHHHAVKTVSATSKRVEVSHDALETRVRILQDKLLEAERKVKASDARANKLEEQQLLSAKSKKSEEGDTKRLMRGLEAKVEESERRVRQRDLEIERLKDKLRGLVEKEKDATTRHREVLSNISRSSADANNASFTSANSSFSSAASPNKSSRSAASAAGARTQKNKMLPIPPIINEMIEALEAQRDGLEQRVAELEEQVHDLQGALRDQVNGDALFGAGAGAGAGAAAGAGRGKAAAPPRPPLDEERERDAPDGAFASETARSMYDKIKEQARKIEQLSKKAEAYRSEAFEAIHAQEGMRARNDELREEIENLRLELETRPSARQWADKQRELQDAENKLHDLVVMRGEAAELAAWRKHLSTSDRIKVDKRNHELGLWLLDSLPKAVAKEVLQTVCRELDVSDVSDIQPSLAKLKAVVKAVPRMERFISQVCEYLFERDRRIRDLGGRGLAGRDRPTMEDVLPVLQSWWLDLQNNHKLMTFQNKVLTEMRRREILLAQEQDPASVLAMEDYQEQWPERDRAAARALELVHDMIDFQVEVFKHKKSFRSAEEFIRDQPEAMVNRQVSHIQYLFGITHLEGLLPQMNKIYLFSEEMKNFLSAAKTCLGLMPSTSDAVALNEIQRVLGVWSEEMKS